MVRRSGLLFLALAPGIDRDDGFPGAVRVDASCARSGSQRRSTAHRAITRTIYSKNMTSSYGTDFHDITSGTSGSYSAVTGYDLVTGWGSPKPALITALAA
ncbi:MAG TPA: hypothetical protein VHT28_15440 [Silvibacterium sp.]|nr:hypothetical protein [Silvibacterium sp.]